MKISHNVSIFAKEIEKNLNKLVEPEFLIGDIKQSLLEVFKLEFNIKGGSPKELVDYIVDKEFIENYIELMCVHLGNDKEYPKTVAKHTIAHYKTDLIKNIVKTLHEEIKNKE